MSTPRSKAGARPRATPHELSASELRWSCDPRHFDFATTDEVEPARRVIGQDRALEALRYGLEASGPGQNIYVRGLDGTGRLTMVRGLHGEIRTLGPPPDDLCCVHDFRAPGRPRMLALPCGKGAGFRDRMDELADALRDEPAALEPVELRRRLSEIERALGSPAVSDFLARLADDVPRRRGTASRPEGWERRYRVNLLCSNDPEGPTPIVIEHVPTDRRLLGVAGIDGGDAADHLTVRPGALLRARGGCLVLEARDVLDQPGAWSALARTLRTGKLELAEGETSRSVPRALAPEPMDVRVKVVLLGDRYLFDLLDSVDPDFRLLFQVLVDFDETIARDATGLGYYASVFARITREERLPPLAREAVVALAEHGSRMASQPARLSARFGRLADLAREAAFLARTSGRGRVEGEDVSAAIRRVRTRADLPARKFLDLVSRGVVRVQTKGGVTGQVNGLAVTQSGPLTYGFPARITATIGPGAAGTIDIERESLLSGSIHTKGFLILGGLLRHLLRTPLAFSASLAFEQNYGQIDGDSASIAEMCCLLSALTGVPLRQGIALTGAMDQFGNVQAVSSVTEKIEGFFAVCAEGGLTRDQGVIIPRGNAAELMLSSEVVEACRAGRFHVWAVDNFREALEILTGRPAGERDGQGSYPSGSLLRLASERAADYWLLAAAVSRGGEEGSPAPVATATTTYASLRASGIVKPAPRKRRRRSS